MHKTGVRAADRSDESTVLSIITLAFSADPMVRWVLPDPGIYLANMPRGARAFGGNGFAHGSVYIVGGGLGAAMWLPPGVSPDVETLQEVMGNNAPAAVQPDLEVVFEKMESYHPSEPHWYLPLMGVDPTQHGKGLGSALMEHALERCDRDGVAAYLESSNPRNISLYQRHGFEILGTIQVGSSPQLVPMLRPAKKKTAGGSRLARSHNLTPFGAAWSLVTW